MMKEKAPERGAVGQQRRGYTRRKEGEMRDKEDGSKGRNEV
jgi:hypothetical protein